MLEAKTALVTGGTRGIGRAVALALSAAGARVECWFHADHESADSLAHDNPSITTRAVEITDHDAVTRAVKDFVAREKKIDVLVNNAGITRDGLLATMSDETWHAVLQTNLTGAYHVCREVVRDMIYQRSGRIINMASLSGVTGLAAQTNYAAAKGGLIAFTKSLALETARYGILVNAVSPGLIDTEVADALPAARKEEIIAHIPLGRMGTPDEVAELVVFLASEKNTYMTGQNFTISGGLYM